MKKNWILRVLAVACVGALMVCGLAGCSQQSSAETEQQAANRAYMSSVNQKIEELAERLTSFEDAVAREDVVTMRTQADNACAVIDERSAIEGPEGQGLEEVQQGYVDGCTTLRDALNAYIDLYTEIESATAEHPFDYATYDDRLAAIQAQYDEGVSKLKAADEKAASL